MNPSKAVGREELPLAPHIDWSQALVENDRWLRTVIYARVGERQAVDEVFQEVSLAAVRQQTPLRNRGKVAPWLYRTAVIQSMLYRRKAGRQRRLGDRYAAEVRPTAIDPRQVDPLGWLLAEERHAGKRPKSRQDLQELADKMAEEARAILDILGPDGGLDSVEMIDELPEDPIEEDNIQPLFPRPKG